MPEIKNTFLQGKMNKDLDERLIPNGQYRNALNVEVSTSEGSDVGTVKNVLGNKRVENLVGSDFKCVGSIADEKNNKLYWFISKYNVDAILEYDAGNDIAKYVFVDKYAGSSKAVLKFFGNVITGINIIDNLLFWTDNQGEPKKINIDTCKAGTTSIENHTQLSFENGSFHGITIKLTATNANNPSYSSEGRYVWFDESQIVKLFYPFGPLTDFVNPFVFNASKYADSDPYLIKHYRDGKFLGKKRVRVFSDNNGSLLRVGPSYYDSTSKDFKVGDVLFGNNVTVDIAEKHITVIKPKPLNAPAVKINHAESSQSTSKIPNLFETKFPRFSYRYKYTDGEYSTFAPFTEPVFNAKYTKDTSKSVDGGVMYNQDTAYDIKEPYNKAMVNAIHSVELSNFITAQTPEDVVEIELLYKQENSSVIYSIETIKHIDKEWHTSSLYEGLGNSIGIGKATNNTVDGQYYAIGGLTKGRHKVTTENIYAALPANQLLRPWDNVPRKALAQEVTGNRIVYANYLQNYNIGSKPQVQVSYGNRQNRLGSFDSKGLPSIKSQRNYQLGVVYCDKYGRETPVFTSNNGAVNIPWQDSSGKKNASKSTQLTVGAVNNFPEWVDSLKFFVKETSNEYYNLTMERAWVTKSTYALDNSEGHLWISFPSSDRNKISEEDYIILKKKIGVGEEQVTFENKFRVIDIKNEAPDAIKYDLVNQGVAQNKTVTGGSFFTGATDRLFTRGFNSGNGHRIDCETDSVHILYENWKASSTAVADESGFRIPLEDVDSGDGADQMPIKTKDLYMSWRYNDENGNEQSSSRYKIVGGTKHGSSYILNLERTITTEDAAIARGDSTSNAMRDDLFFQIEKRELKEEENFSGKFFVKISKNQVSSIIETGKEVSNLDKYQVTAKQGAWCWQDAMYTTGSQVVGAGSYGNTNNFGNFANQSGINSIRHFDNNGITPQVDADGVNELRVTNWHEPWANILGNLDNKPRFFVDGMYMVAGQSEASDYAKYCCVTWSGCTQDDDGDTAENSAWSYPPLKTWLSEFGDTSNLITPISEIETDDGVVQVIPATSSWYENNLISTSLVLNANEDYGDLRIDGWVGPLQNVSRDMPILGTGINNDNHINGLEGLVTTNDFHTIGPRRWFSGLNGTDYGVGDDTKTYSDNGEEDRHFMHLSFFAPGKDLHNNVWTGLSDPKLYGASAWMAYLQGVWGGGVFTGESPSETFGDTDDHTHLAMEGNYDDAGNYLPEPPGPGVGYGYDLNYRELHERQWDPTFLHSSAGNFIGDPGNTIRDFIRNLYPGSKFRFNKANSGSFKQIDDAVYTIKKVTVKKLYNHTSWRKPYNRFISGEGYDPDTVQNIAYQSVEEVALDYLNLCDSSGNTTVSGQNDDLQAKIVQFGASHNRRLCYIIELDKNPASSTSTMGNPLDMTNGGNDGMSGDLVNNNFNDVEFLDPIQDLSLSDLSKFPAIWEVDPKKQEVDLDIYYEASNNIPVRINERTNELFAPIGCKVEIINATPQQELNNVYLESWDGNTAIFNPGFNRSDGNNEIDYTNTAFKFIREDGSYTVAEAGGQQLIGEISGIKSDFLFKEDIGGVIGAGLAWYNCFSFGNGLESNRIRDDFNEMFITNGVKASTTTQQTYEEERRSHGLIYSGIYNSNSGINDLNQFIMAEKITKDLNPTYGTIQKLFQRRISLIAFCEDRVVQIISNKDAIFNADGNPQLISSSNVLGDANPFVGNFGISKNPESFASESYRAYFTDKARGAVLRLSKDGLTPISKAGMHDWFRDNLPTYTSLIGTYDSYKENYNITLSNTYTENIIFNTAFGQGVSSEAVDSTQLNVIADGFINSGDTYRTTYSEPGFEASFLSNDVNGIYHFGNANSKFTNKVTVTNHPAISIGEFQQESGVPGNIIATQNPFGTGGAVQGVDWQPAIYQTNPGSDDGWWYDSDFETWNQSIWTGTGANPSGPIGADNEVSAEVYREINGANITGPLACPWTTTIANTGVTTTDWGAGNNPTDGKKIWYGLDASGTYSYASALVRKHSQCITRAGTGSSEATHGAITFDRANPTNSFVEFRGIGADIVLQGNVPPIPGASYPSLLDYNNASLTPGDADHSSFFNGDEVFIQFELTLFKTLDGQTFGSGGQDKVAWGYNYIVPQIELYDGNTIIPTSKLVTTTTYQSGMSSQEDYAYIQNSASSIGSLGSDFVYTPSSSQYKNNAVNLPSDVHSACVKQYPSSSSTVTFPDTASTSNWNASANPAQGANTSDAGTLKVICGMCVKFRDPNQQDSSGNYTGNGDGIEEVKVINDLRIRISNNKEAASSSYDGGGDYEINEFNNSSNDIAVLRQQLWQVNNVKVKKGFGVVAPHTDFQQEIITFDDPTTPNVTETFTVAQLSDPNTAVGQNAELTADGWVLNYGDIQAVSVGGSSYQANIPIYAIPAWVEVNHHSVDEWTFNDNVGTGSGYGTSGIGQWVTAKTANWFGNNNIGTDVSVDGFTWRLPPGFDDTTLTDTQPSNAQTWPFNPNGLSLGENNFTAQGQGTPGNPVTQEYEGVVSDYWRINQSGNSGNSSYAIHCALGSGNEYEVAVGDTKWYFIDIEYANNASDNGNKNESTHPAVGSYGFPGATNDQDGVVEVAGVANLSATNGTIVDDNGVGTFGGGSASRHIRLVPTWRTEYSDDRWVLRAIYQVQPNSEAANHLDYFSLRFYNFKNHTIYVTKIISKKINYVNGSGTATNWDINYGTNIYDQLHTFSDGVYNSTTDDYSNMYYKDNKLSWENVYSGSAWGQTFQNVIPKTIGGQDPNWTLKFTVGPNPRYLNFTGELGLRVVNSLGDNNDSSKPNDFDGIKVGGIVQEGEYEITFGMNGAVDDANFTIYRNGVTTVQAGTVVAYPDATDGSGASQEQIVFYNNTNTVALNANISGITLTNQVQLFQGGTVASWNFDGFEPTIDDYIIWDGDNSTDGRIQFQKCPTFDPNSTGVAEIITANQLVDKTINRYEKYEISFTYKMTDIVNNPPPANETFGLLHMYYFNSQGYGFRIEGIGDTNNPLTNNNVISNSLALGQSFTDPNYGARKVTMTVEIGSSEAASELEEQGVEALLNTFVIRRDDSDTFDATGWVDNISMKRSYDIEYNDDGELKYPKTTVTFSENVNGWTSFKSFIPEAGLSLSKKYFTLKDAMLYQHYVPTNNATPETAENYNIFYGEFEKSTITAVLNAEPSVVKTFNTLNYEGSQAHVAKPLTAVDQFGNSAITINNAKAWSSGSNIDGWKATEVKTDMDNGNLNSFIKKEGKWFGYIKGKHVVTNALDTSRFSVQGIGFASAIDGNVSTTSGGGSTTVSNGTVTISLGVDTSFDGSSNTDPTGGGGTGGSASY